MADPEPLPPELIGAGVSADDDDGSSFGLPASLRAVLPSDPFEQLDVARKITSIALAGRVSRLESEAAILRHALDEKDGLIADLRARVEMLDASLSESAASLARAQQEKETLLNENASLTNTINKLNRDVSRLEVFKKTLMQSLQEEDETEMPNARVAPKIRSNASPSAGSLIEDDDEVGVRQNNKAYVVSQLSETGNSASDDVAQVGLDGVGQGRKTPRVTSLGGTPRFTPPGSPPRLSATGSPTGSSKEVSPRRQSVSFATTRNIFDDRSSIFSSVPSHHSSMSSPFDVGAQAGRTRVDGKEFFRQVRSRLSYEQFSAFLANVKELNAHKQTKEETLQKAGEIFGPDNKDLYTIFEGLINRNLH